VVTKGSRDGDYCSNWGQVNDDPKVRSAQGISYDDEGWSGFPPRWHCSVYATSYRSGKEPLVQGAIPTTESWLWITFVLLVPPLIWGLAVSLDSARTTR
jgi:hypothetical protein